MRGTKKARTLLKLDRDNVVPFYLTMEQVALYNQDDYKWLIHLLKVFPDDQFQILQYLLLKFHPLIIKTCSTYARKITIDWMDLISFARHSFIELIYRFNLDSTLYFKMYITLALPRAINDYCVYDNRRQQLHNAIRLDELPQTTREEIIGANEEIYGPAVDLQQKKLEFIEFIEHCPQVPPLDRQIFKAFAVNQDYATIAKLHSVSVATARVTVQNCLQLLRNYLQEHGI